MGHHLSIRKTSALGLTVLALALSGLVTAASASAATQHWAGTAGPAAPFVPYAAQQEFSAEHLTGYTLKWTISGAAVTIECKSLTASGSAENPTGGAAGVVKSGSLTLTGCEVNSSPTKCEIKNGAVPLSPLASAVAESGENFVRTGGSVSEMTINSKSGQSCPVVGIWRIEGQPALKQTSGSPGYYSFWTPSKTLAISGYAATLSGEVALKTPAGKLLTESSTVTPGVPHWFVGSSKWTTFTPGQYVNYTTASSASVSISTVIAGASVEIGCGGAGTGFTGRVDNPLGGGWGEITAEQLKLTNCVYTKSTKCLVSPTMTSNPLSAFTSEESNGAPTVEYGPSEGEVLLSFAIQTAAGKTCPTTGTYSLKGYLKADSLGDGNFELSGLKQKVGVNTAVTSGHLLLETEAGEALRLQP